LSITGRVHGAAFPSQQRRFGGSVVGGVALQALAFWVMLALVA